jgi:hypothetical protein
VNKGRTIRSFDGNPSEPTPLPAETPFSLPSEPAVPEPLSEAVDAVAAALNEWDQGSPPPLDLHRHWNRIVSALLRPATPATDTPEGLNVERLARALARLAEVGPPAHLDIALAEEHWESYVTEATDIAAEYDRLAALPARSTEE